VTLKHLYEIAAANLTNFAYLSYWW